jgi:hypothetical protein
MTRLLVSLPQSFGIDYRVERGFGLLHQLALQNAEYREPFGLLRLIID